MTLAKRNLVTIDDFSNGEIEAVFSLADEMAGAVDKQTEVCRGKIMASLFFDQTRQGGSYHDAG